MHAHIFVEEFEPDLHNSTVSSLHRDGSIFTMLCTKFRITQKDDNVDVIAAVVVVAAAAVDDDDDNSDYVNKSNILFSRFRHFISLFCWLSQPVTQALCAVFNIYLSPSLDVNVYTQYLRCHLPMRRFSFILLVFILFVRQLRPLTTYRRVRRETEQICIYWELLLGAQRQSQTGTEFLAFESKEKYAHFK